MRREVRPDDLDLTNSSWISGQSRADLSVVSGERDAGVMFSCAELKMHDTAPTIIGRGELDFAKGAAAIGQQLLYVMQIVGPHPDGTVRSPGTRGRRSAHGRGSGKEEREEAGGRR